MGMSLKKRLALMPRSERSALLARLTDAQVQDALAGAWWYVARPEQLAPPGDWFVWLIQSGRGWGKTRTGAEWLVDEVLRQPEADGVPTEWVIMGQTFGETRDVCVDGPSGVINALTRRGLQRGRDYTYNKSSWQIVFSAGQRIHMLGADDPDAGRGYNLAGAWLDEFAKWRYADRTWLEGLAPALRIGRHPRVVVTTTPKPSVRMLTDWAKRRDGSAVVTRGSTFDNADNLSATALAEMRAQYEGTRIGRQELYGELLGDTEGAIWTERSIDLYRVIDWSLTDNDRVIVAVDPPGETAECGIIVASAAIRPTVLTHAFVLDDASMAGRPEEWGAQVVATWRRWSANGVYVESNQGGDMVRAVIHNIDPRCPVKKITARGSKQFRAEPVATLYEKGRVHHVGRLAMLESQMTTWVPAEAKPGGGFRHMPSPDRLDALVHAITELLPVGKGGLRA